MTKSKSIVLVIALSFLIFGVALSLGSQETSNETQISIKAVAEFDYCCLEQGQSREPIPKAIKLVWQLMENQTIAPTGPALAVFCEFSETTDPRTVIWEIGFPVSPQLMAQPPLLIKRWPHALVVEAFHHGSLNRSHETYVRMLAWMHDRAYVQTGPVLEMYFTDPITTEPDEYKTRIWIPCARQNPSP
jgi:effector-binding domain-containing protein